MRAIVSCACALALVSVVSGCVSSLESVRRYASEDLRCPSTQVRTQDLGAGTFRATGCGRSGFYLDSNAPSSGTTVATRGGTFFTVASAARH